MSHLLIWASMTHAARNCIGKSLYKRTADPSDAPDVVDCSSFTQWLYANAGLTLPRFAYEQFEACVSHTTIRYGRPGDLVFTSSLYPQSRICPLVNIGHVGFLTSDYSVVHACWKGGGVVEESLVDFFNYKARGVCVGKMFKDTNSSP